MSEKRIYVIVAETVQNPLAMKYIGDKHFIMVPTDETKTIVQPVGRIGAQIGHVTSKMRMHHMLSALGRAVAKSKGHDITPAIEEAKVMADEGITTIVLSVPDSYSLEFRHHLLRKAGIKTQMFYDQNDEYGMGVVKTAICTEPIEREKLNGITDYLKLWEKDDSAK